MFFGGVINEGETEFDSLRAGDDAASWYARDARTHGAERDAREKREEVP